MTTFPNAQSHELRKCRRCEQKWMVPVSQHDKPFLCPSHERQPIRKLFWRIVHAFIVRMAG